MYFLCTFRASRNLNFVSSIAKYPSRIVSYGKKVSFSNTQFPIDNIYNLKKDILLYSYDKSRFYKYLSVFGIAQLGVWIFYSGMMYVSLKNVSESNTKHEMFSKSPIWKHIRLGEKKSLISAVILSIGLGLLTTAVCCVFPCRLVKELKLCKGGKTASLVTFGILGKQLQHEVCLKSLSCATSRSEAKSYMPIKVRPKWFYYLLDCRGEFHQPKLFDYTVGTKVFKAY